MMNSIRGKMLLWFGVPVALLFLLLGAVNYIQVKNTVFPLNEELSREVLTARAAEIGRLMHGYISEIMTLSRDDTLREGTWEEIKSDILGRAVTRNTDYEMVFYADTKGDFITSTNGEGNVGDRDYFRAIVEKGADSYVSDPLVSRSTGKNIFVVACPVLDVRGERKGVVAATVLLETLTSIAGSIRMGEKGFGYVVDGTGLLIAHPSEEWRLKLNLLTSADLGFDGLDEAGRMIVAGKPGLVGYRRPDGSKMIAIFDRIPETPGWFLGLALSEDELMGKVTSLARKIILLLLGILIVLLLIVIIVSGRIAGPVAELKRGVRKVSSGDLDYKLEIRTGDEIEELAGAFNKMTVDLKEHIRNLQSETAKRQAVESELQIAKEIQESILPRIFPPFPGRGEFDLYSMMHPAKEVGGDFYDFFFYDKNNFVMIIGDVSGKGVPAALFMMLSRTLIHTVASEEKDPARVLKKVNDIVAADNETSMFITVFLAYYDVETGKLTYSNAGHTPALKITAGKKVEELTTENSVALGAMPGVEYRSGESVLDLNDKFVLYTDGVNEAINRKGEFYGTRRFIDHFLQDGKLSAREECAAILKDVMDFQEEKQHDDITITVFKRLE
ncbi:MAG: SpoIIE family protein phosphatase [PVC group bacterium]